MGTGGKCPHFGDPTVTSHSPLPSVIIPNLLIEARARATPAAHTSWAPLLAESPSLG